MNKQGDWINAHYQAYLVRFWRGDESGSWRAFAKNIQTGDEHHFTSVERCVTFLKNIRLDSQAEPKK